MKERHSEKEKIGDNGTTLCATYLWRTGSTEGVPAETRGESANTGRGRNSVPPSPMVFREEIVTDRCESTGILLETKEFLNGNPYEHFKTDNRRGADESALTEWYENGRKYQEVTQSGLRSTVTAWYDTGEKAGEMVAQGSHEPQRRDRKDGSVAKTTEGPHGNGQRGRVVSMPLIVEQAMGRSRCLRNEPVYRS